MHSIKYRLTRKLFCLQSNSLEMYLSCFLPGLGSCRCHPGLSSHPPAIDEASNIPGRGSSSCENLGASWGFPCQPSKIKVYIITEGSECAHVKFWSVWVLSQETWNTSLKIKYKIGINWQKILFRIYWYTSFYIH